MVKHSDWEGGVGAAMGVGMTGALDATFGALSDATRRGILAQLALGETTVSELAAPYEMSLPAVSKHLRVLENAGLVTRHKDGRVHRCRLIAEPMKNAAEWIERYRVFWEEQFDALERYLAETGALTTPVKPELLPPRTAKGVEAISNLKFEISKEAKAPAAEERAVAVAALSAKTAGPSATAKTRPRRDDKHTGTAARKRGSRKRKS